MRPTVSLRKALYDPKLLGNVLAGPSWRPWRVLLIAANGEELTSPEREIFTQLTQREYEPLMRVEELVAVVGRRGGKSRAMSTLAVYIACLCEHDELAPGERGIVLCIAPDQRQSAIVLAYATAAIEQSPILRQLIQNRTSDTLELTNGITLEVRAASHRRLRGPTYVAVIADEAAFWYSEEFSSNADVEILNAVRPGLATTGGPLIIASSPYARRGVLWSTYKRHFGPAGDALVLVAQGPSRTFNPSLPRSVVDRAMERDRTAASAEYLAMFRADIESFVPLEVVESCVADFVELPPDTKHRYHAFCDPSGGSADSFTLAISHRDGQRVVIDAIREVQPPFSPEQVIADFVTLLKSFRVRQVEGDRYAGEFPRELFRKHGVAYKTADKTKSDLFRDLLPHLNSGSVVLPRSDRLVNQLTGLERRTTRGGKDSIDHAPGAHDDLANAVAGACNMIAARREPAPLVVTTWDGEVMWTSERKPEQPTVNEQSTRCEIDFRKLEREPVDEKLFPVRRNLYPRIW